MWTPPGAGQLNGADEQQKAAIKSVRLPLQLLGFREYEKKALARNMAMERWDREG
jgi:hypothetical protein